MTGRWNPRPAAMLAALLLAACLLAGCGSDSTGTSGAPESEPDRQEQRPTMTGAARAEVLGFDASRVFERVSAGVVTVRAIFGADGDLTSPGATGSEGSGFVLDENGEIITNAHVVTTDGLPEREVAEQVFVEFPDRNVIEAEVLGADPFYDVALLKIDPDDLELTVLELGDDRELVVGQPVAAIGSPFGAQQSLSVGVVSATDRSVRSLTEFQIEGAIQTDASINPGNSGGPLLDAEGHVVGINQQIETQTGRHDGVGYAVPVSAVIRSADQIREDGRVAYAYIGVSSQSLYPQLANRLGLDVDFGGLVSDVVSGGPADEAGLRGGQDQVQFQAGRYETGGDVIISVDDNAVIRPDDLARFVAGKRPGDQVTLEILRDGEREEIEITLGERPTSRDLG